MHPVQESSVDTYYKLLESSKSFLVSFPDPAFKLDKAGLAHFARNLGLADSALPEIWRTNQIAFTC